MAVLGIDLGTTNCACSIIKNGEVKNVPNRLGKLLTPSVVGLDDNNQIIAGEAAKERLITHPAQTVAFFKRLMGTDAEIKLKKQKFTPPELSSILLRYLKEDAEHFLSGEISEAVVSVPAYFNENQRVATKIACEMAGLKVLRLINEPTAASIAYGLNTKEPGTFMVLDMGGGTFDVSILEYFSGVMEVHASAGDNFLGGEDIVNVMAEAIIEALELDRTKLSQGDLASLLRRLEQIKRTLTSKDKALVEFKYNQSDYRFDFTYEWFIGVITPLLMRVKKPILQALNDSGLHSSQLDDIILVGGSTKLFAFRQLISSLFGRLPSCNIDPDLVVSMGAGIQAGLAEKHEALDDIILTDVCPFSLGTEVVNDEGQAGFFMPIIERNTVVPVSIEREVFTIIDSQQELDIRIFQGEHRLVKNNVFLGNLDVKIPRGKRGKEGAKIRYSYDMNGLLEVDVTVISTGKTYSKTIQNAPGMLTDSQLAEARKKLAKLKFHPRDSENVRVVKARAERIYQMLKGQEREQFGLMVNQFESVVESQNKMKIEKAANELTKSMESIDEAGLCE